MMNRLCFLFLLSLSAFRCGGAAEFDNLRGAPPAAAAATAPIHTVVGVSHQRQRSLSSSDIKWYWLLLNHLGLHLGDCHIHSEKSSECPHPPHPPHKKSGGSSSSGSSGSSSSSGGGGSSSSSSSGSGSSGSSSSSGGASSSAVNCSNDDNCEENNNCCKAGAEAWGADGWKNDGWESNNLDNGGATSGAGASVQGVSAKSIIPFVVGALVAAAIGAAFVVAMVSNLPCQSQASLMRANYCTIVFDKSLLLL